MEVHESTGPNSLKIPLFSTDFFIHPLTLLLRDREGEKGKGAEKE
jgi:hypothetical protein